MTTEIETTCRRMTAALNDFCQFVLDHPGLAEPGDGWNAHAMLAHLVFYHECYLEQAQAILAGRQPRLLSGTYAQINQEAVRFNREATPAQLAVRFQAANRQLCDLACQPGNASLPIPIKKKARPWPLATLLQAVESHIRNHHQDLKRYSHEPGRSS